MATTPNIFKGLKGRFTFVPLNINDIAERSPDNGEVLANYSTGELSIAIVNENTGEIINILKPFDVLHEKNIQFNLGLTTLSNNFDTYKEITNSILQEIVDINNTEMKKTNNQISNLAALQAMNTEV